MPLPLSRHIPITTPDGAGPLPPLSMGVEETVRVLCRDALLEHVASVLRTIRSRGRPDALDPGGTVWIDVLFASMEERAELLARQTVAAVRGEGQGAGKGKGGRC